MLHEWQLRLATQVVLVFKTGWPKHAKQSIIIERCFLLPTMHSGPVYYAKHSLQGKYNLCEWSWKVCCGPKMLDHVTIKIHSYYTAIALCCCTAHLCDVTALWCRMKVWFILTWNAVTCCRDVIDLSAPQHNCGVGWTGLKPYLGSLKDCQFCLVLIQQSASGNLKILKEMFKFEGKTPHHELWPVHGDKSGMWI